MSDAAGTTEPGPNELKAEGFQREFDILLLGLLAAGFLIALLYGWSAGICPPDPQRAPVVVQTSISVTAEPAPTAPGAAGQARGQVVSNAVTNGAAAASATASASQPQRCKDGGSFSGRVVAILLALAISLAALALGALLGFLFGLPRSLTSSDVRAAATAKAVAQDAAQAAGQAKPATDAPADGGAVGGTSGVNTNLEKISDWLTTIIVGVGLTKLEELPGGLESFGERVAPYFGYGGKVFGIAGGLFFLIGGFFLGYVGTRVKLSLIFLLSQLLHRDAAITYSQVVRTALGAELNLSPTGAAASDEVKKADDILLARSLSDLKTTDEVLAWAKAKARAGDFASALAAYRDVVTKLPLTEKLQTDYAQILAASGDTVGANNVVSSLATTGISPQAEQEARQKIAAAAQAGQVAAQRSQLLTRLREGLYKPAGERGYEESIAAGEQLLSGVEPPRNVWIHVWLAAAYGQKHAVEKAAAGDAPTDEQRETLATLRSLVVEQVRKALEIDSSVKAILRGLYDPAYGIGDDDDLESLFPDEELAAILIDQPPGQP